MKALRAGTQTGSLVNHLLSGSLDPRPALGMGATILMWTDRHPATVIEVNSATRITVREDRATRTDKNGMSDSQSYAYETNPYGRVEVYTLRKNGAWVRQGDTMRGQRLSLGHRSEYRDFSF